MEMCTCHQTKWRGRKNSSVGRGRTVFALFVAAFLIGIMLRPLVEELGQSGKETAAMAAASQNDDCINRLREEVWRTLGPEERLEVLKTVAELEGSALGLPFEVRVQEGELHKQVAGSYEHGKHRITIREEYLRLGTARKLLETLAHELCHAYQHCLVDLYQENRWYQDLALFSQANVPEFCREFNNYQNGEGGNIEAYYQQQVEVEASAFARQIVAKYDDILAGEKTEVT